MKKSKEVLLLLLTIVFIIAAFQDSYGLRICDYPFGSPGGSPGGCQALRTDPTAPGTKLTGPLTIMYTPTGSYCDDGMPMTDMTFIMRLAHDSTLVAFYGSKPGVCFFDFSAQQAAIEDLIDKAVIPAFFPDNPDAPFAIKAVKDIVEDNEAQYPSCCGSSLFTIMDINIAVRN